MRSCNHLIWAAQAGLSDSAFCKGFRAMLTPGRFQTDPHLLKKAVAFGNTRDLKKGAKKRRLMSKHPEGDAQRKPGFGCEWQSFTWVKIEGPGNRWAENTRHFHDEIIPSWDIHVRFIPKWSTCHHVNMFRKIN